MGYKCNQSVIICYDFRISHFKLKINSLYLILNAYTIKMYRYWDFFHLQIIADSLNFLTFIKYQYNVYPSICIVLKKNSIIVLSMILVQYCKNDESNNIFCIICCYRDYC